MHTTIMIYGRKYCEEAPAELQTDSAEREKLTQLEKTKAAYQTYQQNPKALDSYFKEICLLDRILSGTTTDYSYFFGNGKLYRCALNILQNPNPSPLRPAAASYRAQFDDFSTTLRQEPLQTAQTQARLRELVAKMRTHHLFFQKEVNDTYDELHPDSNRNLSLKYRTSALAFIDGLLAFRAKGEPYHRALLEKSDDPSFRKLVPLLALYQQKITNKAMPELFTGHEKLYNNLSVTENDLTALQNRMVDSEKSPPLEEKGAKLLATCSGAEKSTILEGLTRFGIEQATGFAKAVDSARREFPEGPLSFPIVAYFLIKSEAIAQPLLRTDILLPVLSLQKTIQALSLDEEKKLLNSLHNKKNDHYLYQEFSSTAALLNIGKCFELPNFSL